MKRLLELAAVLTLWIPAIPQDPVPPDARDTELMDRLEAALRAGEAADVLALYNACMVAHGELGPLADPLDALLEDVEPGDRRRAALRLRGHLAWRYGDLDTAESCFEELSEDPADLEARLDHARLLDARGDREGALEAYGSLVPELGDEVLTTRLLVRMALMNMAGGGEDEADALSDFARAEGRSLELCNRAAIVLALLGRPADAIELYRVDGDAKQRTRGELRIAEWALRSEDAPAAQAAAWNAMQLATVNRERLYALTLLTEAHRLDDSLPQLIAKLAELRDELPPQARRVWIDLLRETGAYDEAIAMLASDSEAFSADERRALIEMYREAGREEDMIAAYRERIAADPAATLWREGLSQTFLEAGDRASALAVWDDWMTEHGEGSRLLGAEVLRGLGLDELAVESAEAAVSADADPFAALLFLFDLYRDRGHLDQAREALARLDEAAEPDAAVRFQIAESYERLGDQAQAVAVLEDLVAARPPGEAGEDVAMRLAWLLSEVGREDQALEAWRELWTRVGSVPRRRYVEDRMMTVAARLGTLADIAVDLELKLMEGTADERDSGLLVRLYTKVGDAVSAAEVIEEYLRRTGGSEVKSLTEKARVYLACNDYFHYEEAVQRLIEIDPEGEADYLQQLAMSQLERGRPDEARAVLQRLQAFEGEGSSAEFEAGVLALSGLRAEAVGAYRRGLALHPERIDGYLLMAGLMKQLGENDLAFGMFQHLAETADGDDLFTIAIDGVLNMLVDAPPRPKVVEWARRITLERLATRHDKPYLYQLLADLAEEEGDHDGHLVALENSLASSGPRRGSVLRELMDLCAAQAPTFGVEARPAQPEKHLAFGRRLVGLAEAVPPQVYLDLGAAFLEADDISSAKRTFGLTRDLPDGLLYQRQSAVRFEEAGYVETALETFESVLATQPSDVALLVKVGELHEQLGDDATAGDLYRRAMDLLMRRRPLHTGLEGEDEEEEVNRPGGPLPHPQRRRFRSALRAGARRSPGRSPRRGRARAGPGHPARGLPARASPGAGSARRTGGRPGRQRRGRSAVRRHAPRAPAAPAAGRAAPRRGPGRRAHRPGGSLRPRAARGLPRGPRGPDPGRRGPAAVGLRLLGPVLGPGQPPRRDRQGRALGPGGRGGRGGGHRWRPPRRGAAPDPAPGRRGAHRGRGGPGAAQRPQRGLRRGDRGGLGAVLRRALPRGRGSGAVGRPRVAAPRAAPRARQLLPRRATRSDRRRPGSQAERSLCRYFVSRVLEDVEKNAQYVVMLPKLAARFDEPIVDQEEILTLLDGYGERYAWGLGPVLELLPSAERAGALRGLWSRVENTQRSILLLELVSEFRDDLGPELSNFVVESFQSGLEHAPDHISYSIAQLLDLERNHEVAVDLAQALETRFPGDAAVRATLALSRHALGEEEAVEQGAELWAELAGENATDYARTQARNRLAETFLPEFLEAFAQALDAREEEEGPSVALALGRIALFEEAEDDERADALLRQACADHPEDIDLLNRLWRRERSLGRRAEAARALERLAELTEDKNRKRNHYTNLASEWRALRHPERELAARTALEALDDSGTPGLPPGLILPPGTTIIINGVPVTAGASEKGLPKRAKDVKEALEDGREDEAATILRRLWRNFPKGEAVPRFGYSRYSPMSNLSWPRAPKEAEPTRGGLEDYKAVEPEPEPKPPSAFDELAESDRMVQEMQRFLRTRHPRELDYLQPMFQGILTAMRRRLGDEGALEDLLRRMREGKASKADKILLLAALDDRPEGAAGSARDVVDELVYTLNPQDAAQVRRLARALLREERRSEALRMFRWCATRADGGRGMFVFGTGTGSRVTVRDLVQEARDLFEGEERLALIEAALGFAHPGDYPWLRERFEVLVLETWEEAVGPLDALARTRDLCAAACDPGTGLRRGTSRRAAALFAHAGELDAALKALEVGLAKLDPDGVAQPEEIWYRVDPDLPGHLSDADLRRLFPLEISEMAQPLPWLTRAAGALEAWLAEERVAEHSTLRALSLIALRLDAAGDPQGARRLADRLAAREDLPNGLELWIVDVLRRLGEDERADARERDLLARGTLHPERVPEVLGRILEDQGPQAALEAVAPVAEDTRHPELLKLLVRAAEGARDDDARTRWSESLAAAQAAQAELDALSDS